MKYAAIAALLFLTSCVSTNTTPGLALGMFVMGDLKNGESLAQQAGLSQVVGCYQALEPVAMQTPNPSNDGLLTLITREMALRVAVSGPCGSILAPILLQAIGKIVPAPLGVALPF